MRNKTRIAKIKEDEIKEVKVNKQNKERVIRKGKKKACGKLRRVINRHSTKMRTSGIEKIEKREEDRQKKEREKNTKLRLESEKRAMN